MAQLLAEGGEGESSFLSQDAKKNAASGGVDVDQLAQYAKQFISFAMAINNLTRDETNNKLDQKDRTRARYNAGIVYARDGESRIDLVENGKIPPYYSTTNIKELLLTGKLPWGWSEGTAVKQGFGKEIAAAKFRQHADYKTDRMLRNLQDKRNTNLLIQQNNELAKNFRLHKTLDQLKNVIT